MLVYSYTNNKLLITPLSRVTVKAVVSRLISTSRVNIKTKIRPLQSRDSTSASLRRLPNISNNNNAHSNYSHDNLFRISGIPKKSKSLICSSMPKSHKLILTNGKIDGAANGKVNGKENIIANGKVNGKVNGIVNEASSAKYLVNGSNEDKKSDLIVVLDMDECLIHSQFLTLDTETYRQKESRPSNTTKNIKTDFCDSFCITLSDEENQKNHIRKSTSSNTYVHVNKRPNLEHFLNHVTSKYQTYIFTAAMKIYANPVLNVILNDQDHQNRFYRESCVYDANLGVYIKDLNSILQTHQHNELKRVVLVDNNPLSFLANPSNGILVSSFYDDPKDDTLPAVVDLLDELDGLDDVRPALHHLFGLEDALNDIILPSENSAANW